MSVSGCRALVAGFGRPGLRDLDFGRQLVDCLQQLDWPDGAAARPTAGLDDLCDRVLTACTADGRRDDDICLLALRRQPSAVPAH